ncbi:hypothetical protein SAMN05421663_104278 [Terribacillus halophilus]|uniref:DUF1453 domain-containing protein n=1 Tax=Terribacillus halophilus TaxID=361279 RepID=A0A1G6PVA7_9BACI|nr:DUF6622 family protein [Terribacillus halophilus]SDC84142.1 hypothetical protein SAMN05421663_104278 [Terribacillus halophilus]
MYTLTKEVFLRTPIWVWILLFILIKRGIAISQERPVHFTKMFLVPGIFMIWGLDKIITDFPHIIDCMTSYVIFILIGGLIGYSLYKRYQMFFMKDGIMFRTKCYLPLIVILINFAVKYLLNVFLEISPTSINDIIFNIVYSSINGLSVGLFFGGILYTYQIQSKLDRSILES